jgi:hypothetical protein
VKTFSVVACVAASLALSACATVDADNLSTTYLDQFAAPNPTLGEFPVCHGFGCSLITRASLSNAEWRRVAAVFRPPPKDAEAERRRIARAVALMQIMVGPKTGTAAPQWTHKDLMVLRSGGDPTQLDCIDEAVNTWTYMTMMERDGLFRFHRVAKLSHAGGLTDLANVRNTAVLQEKGGDYFAIDPSLVDHGVLPPVMPLSTWLGTWPPNIALSNERVDARLAERDAAEPASRASQHASR